jgi:ABC-type multidrug transport system fused ATPase/permease subunit
MSAQKNKSADNVAKGDHSAREAITYYNPVDEREPDKAPLQSKLIRRIFRYTKPYAAKRNWLHMEVGDLVMFFFLANLFFDPIQNIGNQLNQALMAMAGGERLFRMLDQKPEWQDAADAKPLARIQGRVEFQSVNFEYKTGRPVLVDISFTVEPGQSVALVGHTGSGKTTLVGLLQKFYLTTNGKIFVDGFDLNSVTGDSLRSQMGSVQ